MKSNPYYYLFVHSCNEIESLVLQYERSIGKIEEHPDKDMTKYRLEWNRRKIDCEHFLVILNRFRNLIIEFEKRYPLEVLHTAIVTFDTVIPNSKILRHTKEHEFEYDSGNGHYKGKLQTNASESVFYGIKDAAISKGGITIYFKSALHAAIGLFSTVLDVCRINGINISDLTEWPRTKRSYETEP